jgi:hypothetical protein
MEAEFNPSVGTFTLEHRDDLLRAPVAEHLAGFLLVMPDAVTLKELQKIVRSETGERGSVKVGVPANKVSRAGMQVGEVAAAAAADQDLIARLFPVFEHKRGAPPLSGLDRTEHSGGAAADDNDIFLHFASMPRPWAKHGQ